MHCHFPKGIFALITLSFKYTKNMAQAGFYRRNTKKPYPDQSRYGFQRLRSSDPKTTSPSSYNPSPSA